MSTWVAPILRKTGNILQLLADAVERQDSGKAARADTIVGEIQSFLIPASQFETNEKAGKDPVSLASLVRDEQLAREERASHVPPGASDETPWAMLVDLFYDQLVGTRTRLPSSRLLSDPPRSVALRYISLLCEMGMIASEPSETDDGHDFLKLTPKGRLAMEGYFTAISERRIVNLKIAVPRSAFAFEEAQPSRRKNR